MEKLSLFGLAILLGGTLQASEKISYARFLEVCKTREGRKEKNEPEQNKPQQIKILCVDEKLVWKPAASATFGLEQKRKLNARLFSDRYHVETPEYALSLSEAAVDCPRMREFLETVAVEKPLSCADVLNRENGLKHICKTAVDSAVAATPDIADSVPTGRVRSACGEK